MRGKNNPVPLQTLEVSRLLGARAIHHILSLTELMGRLTLKLSIMYLKLVSFRLRLLAQVPTPRAMV